MLALIQLVITVWIGRNLLRVLPVSWYKIEFWAAAYIVGLLVTTWLLFVFSLIFGYTWGIPLALIVGGGGSYYLQAWVTNNSKKQLQLENIAAVTPLSSKHTVWIFLYLSGWILLLWALFFTRSFQIKDAGWYSGGNTWGDIAIHSTLIYSFEQHDKPSLIFPIYPQNKLTYPFLFDFYTATLMKEGWSIQSALLVTGLTTTVAVLILSFFLLWRLTKSFFVAALTGILFFLNSTTGTMDFFIDWKNSDLSFWKFISALPENYVHSNDRGLSWIQVVIDLILPQRGIIVGIAVFLLFCLGLYLLFTESATKHAVQSAKKTVKSEVSLQTLRYGLLLLLGLLPFFHVHTFLVILGLFIWYLLWAFATSVKNGTPVVATTKEILGDWLGPLLVLVVLCLPQLYWQFGNTFGKGFTFVQLGWLKEEQTFLTFWARNLGLQGILAIIGTIYVYRSKTVSEFFKVLVFPLLALFAICNIISFQPHVWDNTKFMVYSHWAMIVVSVLFLQYLLALPSQIARNLSSQNSLALNRLLSVFVVVSCITVLASGGVLAVTKELQSSDRIATTQDLVIAEFVRENTEPDALFLTSDAHNHLIPMLTGRPIVMGYRGWLWTYGINYRQTELEVLRMYRGGPEALELLKEKKVAYVFVGPREKSSWQVNEGFFEQFEAIYSDKNTTIYKLNF